MLAWPVPSVVSVRAAGAFRALRALRVNHSVVSVRAAGAFRALRVNHSVVSVFQSSLARAGRSWGIWVRSIPQSSWFWRISSRDGFWAKKFRTSGVSMPRPRR